MLIGGMGGDGAWKEFVRRHAKFTVLMVGGVAATALAALSVFLWVVANVQASGLVPSVLGQWTVGHVLTFILNVILWELLLVASWVLPLAVIVFFRWFKNLPDEEWRGYRGARQRRRAAGGGGGISFFTGLVWFVIVWAEAKWTLALKDWTFNDLVYSWIAAGLVVFLVIGIPATIYVVWSLRKKG
jgi:hypothetical protein